jgi:flagellar biosynthetic protein FlhB/flagellar biosynthesis protein
MAEEASIAVALKYDKENDQAPKLVAKGIHIKAEKIREIAKQYGIPIMKNVNLANTLYRVDIGQEIPESLYDAVAEVLNFVYALQQEEREREAKRRQAAQQRR